MPSAASQRKASSAQRQNTRSLSADPFYSTALALVIGSVPTGPAAFAQSVTASGDVLPVIPAPPVAVWTPGNLRVGVDGIGDLTVLDGGTVAGTGQAIIGVNAGSSGTVTVSGSGSTLSTVTQMHVGSRGAGVLNIEDGAAVGVGTFLYIGRFDGSDGVVTVTGSGSSLTNSSMIQVGSEGKGALIIEDGATVNSTNVVRIGFAATSEGSVLVDGPGSTWTSNNTVSVGYGGNGTLTIANGGTVSNVDGFIGREAGSTGEVTVSGAGSSWSVDGSLTVGDRGTGSLSITNGGSVSSSDAVLGNNVGGVGSAQVVGAGSIWDAGPIVVGNEGSGTLTIANGGVVSGSVTLGQFTTGVGTATVTGAGSTWNTWGGLTVGAQGSGTLTIADGGVVNGRDAYIGESGVGNVTVTGAGSALNLDEGLYLGNSGSGTLIVTDGGFVRNGRRATLGQSPGAVGIATVSGAGSTWLVDSDFYIGQDGSGTLTIADGGRVEMVDDGDELVIARYAGSDGTLNIGAAPGDPATGAGMLVVGEVAFGDGSGTINFNHTDGAYVFSPVITGNGSLNQYAGTTILTGNNTYTGDTTIAGGVLQVGNGGTRGSVSGDIDIGPAGTLRVDRSNAWTYAGVLSGTGAFDHVGRGVTTLTGDSSGFAGTTTVGSGARLIVGTASGGTLGGSITIGSGGLLGGIGDLGSAGSTVAIAAGGVHAPGNGLGQQTVLGGYALRGTLQIDGTPTGTDTLVVHGGLDIAGSGLDLLLSPAAAASWNVVNGPFTIIDNRGAGAVNGTFAAVHDSLIFLDPHVTYAGGDGNDVTLGLVRNDVAFASVALTPNQIATSGAIDTLPFGNPVWNAITLMTHEDTARRSFDLLSGEIHATARGVLLDESRFIRNAVNDRIRAAFDSVGASRMPVMAYASGGAQRAPVTTDRFAVWGHAFGSWGDVDGDGNAARLDRSTGGFFTGADAAMLESWRFGAIAGYSRTTFNVGDRLSSGTGDTYHVGLYGGTTWGDLSFRTGAAHAWHGITTDRSVAVPGLRDSLEADYTAGTAQVFGELGHGVRAGNAAFEPFANFAHVALNARGFTEDGRAAALTSQGETTKATFTTLGLRGAMTFDLAGATVTANGMGGWRHAFGDVTPLSTMQFVDGGDTFTIAGVPIARDAAVVEAGLDVALSPNATFGVSYGGQLGSGATDQTCRASFNATF